MLVTRKVSETTKDPVQAEIARQLENGVEPENVDIWGVVQTLSPEQQARYDLKKIEAESKEIEARLAAMNAESPVCINTQNTQPQTQEAVAQQPSGTKPIQPFTCGAGTIPVNQMIASGVMPGQWIPQIPNNQAAPVSGNVDIDSVVNLLCHPSMIAQMSEINKHLINYTASVAKTKKDEAKATEFYNMMNMLLNMLKDPSQTIQIKKWIGESLADTTDSDSTIEKFFTKFGEFAAEQVSGKCACGHEHAPA